MPTAAIIAGLGAAAGTTVAGTIGAAKTSSAAKYAANVQTAAAKEAAQIQAQSAREALDFQKAESERTQREAEATRRANYDQWAAGQRRAGTLGQLLGLPAPEIPAYVPIGGGQPGTLGAAAGMPAGGTSPMSPMSPTGQATPGGLGGPGGDYQGWFMSQIAGKPFNQQTLLDLEPALNQAGLKLTPPNAAGERTKIQLPDGTWVRVGFGEGRPVWIPQPTTGMAAPTAQAPYGTLGNALTYRSPTLTPALSGAPYGSLGYGMRN